MSKDAIRGIQETSWGPENHRRRREERIEVHGDKTAESNTENYENQRSSSHKTSKETVSNPTKGVEEQVENGDRVDLIQNIREKNDLLAEEENVEHFPINNKTNMATRNKKQSSWKRSARKHVFFNSAGDIGSKTSIRKRVNEDNEEAGIKKQKGLDTDNSMEVYSSKEEVGGSQPRRSL